MANAAPRSQDDRRLLTAMTNGVALGPVVTAALRDREQRSRSSFSLSDMAVVLVAVVVYRGKSLGEGPGLCSCDGTSWRSVRGILGEKWCQA